MVNRNLKHQNIGIPTSTKGIWSENHVFLEWIAKTNPGSIENLPVAGMSEAQAGVRNLQKHIERICRKMATKVVEKWEGRLGLSGFSMAYAAWFEADISGRQIARGWLFWRCWDVVK